MSLDGSITTEIGALKRKVKEVIGEVNALKTQLEHHEISLEEFRGKKELLENQLREILEKISQYKETGTADNQKDASLAEEAKRLMYEFQTELAEKISKPKVYLSASLVDHFIFEIDFTNYPEKPELITPDSVKKLFNVPFEKKLSILTNWDPQQPPHITEIFYEIESTFLKIFQSDEILETNLNQERIHKILARRKLLAATEYELESNNIKKAIEYYQDIIKLSYELEDYERADKFSKLIAELKKTLEK